MIESARPFFKIAVEPTQIQVFDKYRLYQRNSVEWFEIVATSDHQMGVFPVAASMRARENIDDSLSTDERRFRLRVAVVHPSPGKREYLSTAVAPMALVSKEADAMSRNRGLRFAPSRVEGVPSVTEVAIFPDRLELLSAGRWVSFRLEDFAVWPYPAFLWRRLSRAGWRRGWRTIGERDWFRASSERCYRFYTWPQIAIYTPDETMDVEYGETLFRQVEDVLLAGGFRTWDLG